LYVHVKLCPAFKFKGLLSYNILQTDSNDLVKMYNPNKYSFIPIDSIFGIISISIVYEIKLLERSTNFYLRTTSLSERPVDVIINYDDNMDLPPFYVINRFKEMDVYAFYNLIVNAPPLTTSTDRSDRLCMLTELLNELDEFKLKYHLKS
jgi:hypothetical protein